jgi:hypothetical protein
MSSSGRNQQHVCFYSNKCRWSAAFLTEIAKTPYKDEFKFICVDASPTRPQLPSWLKKVPTIVVKGEKEPRTDGDVMNWLAERRLTDSNRPKAPDVGPGGHAGASGPLQSAEPEAWMPGEMGGNLTKSFSYLDGDAAPPHNFEFLQGNNAVGVRTASDMPGGGLGARGQEKSKKEELFDKQMESYLKNRTNGMPPPVMRQ